MFWFILILFSTISHPIIGLIVYFIYRSNRKKKYYPVGYPSWDTSNCCCNQFRMCSYHELEGVK